jgi:hypothetical protein
MLVEIFKAIGHSEEEAPMTERRADITGKRAVGECREEFFTSRTSLRKRSFINCI